MITREIEAARAELERLVSAVEGGEDVEIARDGVAVVRLVAVRSGTGCAGARLVDWLESNPLPHSATRSTREIDEAIAEARGSWTPSSTTAR